MFDALPEGSGVPTTMLRTFATFSSTQPDDTGYDDAGHVAVPGGQSILAALREGMASKGWNCTMPEQHSFYGWEFTISSSSGTIMILLQYPGPWLLLVTNQPSFWAQLWGRVDDNVDPHVVTDVHGVLSADPGISGLVWYSRGEYENPKAKLPGCPTPV